MWFFTPVAGEASGRGRVGARVMVDIVDSNLLEHYF
jgi:hypothetical protein